MRRAAGAALALAVVMLARPQAARAQEPASRAGMLTVEIAPDTVAVGQPFVVRLRVRAPKSAVIKFPALPDSGDAIEAIDPRVVEEAPSDAVLDQTAVYRVAAWNTGAHTARFGPVLVTIGANAASYAVSVPPVYVSSLLPADTTQYVPKDARDPFPVPSGLWRLVLVIAVILALATWYFLRRRRKAARPAAPVLEAYVETSAAFRALETLALADAGESGRHVIAHVDVLRTYLARRFPGAPSSLTPAEMRVALATSDFPVLPDRVDALLTRDADIRYAHAEVTRHEAVALAAEARAIARDVQDAYEARQRAAERGPQRPARR